MATSQSETCNQAQRRGLYARVKVQVVRLCLQLKTNEKTQQAQNVSATGQDLDIPYPTLPGFSKCGVKGGVRFSQSLRVGMYAVVYSFAFTSNNPLNKRHRSIISCVFEQSESPEL